MKKVISSKVLLMFLFTLLFSFNIFAEEAVPLPINTGDTAWILMSSAMVLLMTMPALGLFYGGMVRKKNILSTFYYSFGAAIIVSILWVVCLYSLSFGGADIKSIIGNLDKVMLKGVEMTSIYPTAPSIPEIVFSFFQLTFAIITVALISGALVERMRFSAWLIFAAVWSIVVYAPLAHMVWNPDGVLFKLGALDFAGGLVVHISSGVSALVACIMLGERVRYKKEAMMPSNIPFVFIGASLLWFGWFGFNGGSALGANALAGSAVLVTNTCAAVAALTWMLIEWKAHGKPSIIGAASGLVAGLVAITPAAGFVDVNAAVLMGIVVSFLCYFFVVKVKKHFNYDDSLDAFGIHGVGGTWGAIATGLFANPKVNALGTGLFYGNPKQLWIQLISVGVGYAIAIIGTVVVISILKKLTKVRVEPQEEINGLDLVLHGERVSE